MTSPELRGAVPSTNNQRVFTRAELAVDPLELAERLLGSELESHSSAGTVRVRVVEVEAYRGLDDPASHCYRGRTKRNEVMWGPAGRLYVYFVYGMHFCANVVGLEEGHPGAVLLRAGDVIEGQALAQARRPTAPGGGAWAKGPAVLTSMLGIQRQHNDIDLTDWNSPVRLLAHPPVPGAGIRTGPRVGVSAAMDIPWRFWIDGASAVSNYRRGGKRRARTGGNTAEKR